MDNPTQPEVDWTEFQEESDTNILDTLSRVCRHKQGLDRDIEEAEQRLKDLKAEQRRYVEDIIPSILLNNGLSEVKLEDNSKVTIKKVYTGHIKQENWDEVEEYLEAHNEDSIIKRETKVDFGKGQTEASVKLMMWLREQNMTYKSKSYIHPMTLKSYIKTKMEDGENFPMELFGANVINQAVVK